MPQANLRLSDRNLQNGSIHAQTPEIQPTAETAQEAALRALSEKNVRHPIVGTVEPIDCILVQRVWRWHFIGVRIDWRKTGPGFQSRVQQAIGFCSSVSLRACCTIFSPSLTFLPSISCCGAKSFFPRALIQFTPSCISLSRSFLRCFSSTPLHEYNKRNF